MSAGFNDANSSMLHWNVGDATYSHTHHMSTAQTLYFILIYQYTIKSYYSSSSNLCNWSLFYQSTFHSTKWHTNATM